MKVILKSYTPEGWQSPRHILLVDGIAIGTYIDKGWAKNVYRAVVEALRIANVAVEAQKIDTT